MTNNWAKLYFAVSTILSFVGIVYYENILALEFALQDDENHLLAILVSFSCPLVIVAQFYASLQLLAKQISAAETTVRRRATLCFGVVFFLFWIGIIWFLNGQDPLSAAAFRVNHLNYQMLVVHTGVGVYFFGFFKDLNSRHNRKSTKSLTFDNYIWVLWFLAIFHLGSLHTFISLTSLNQACTKAYGPLWLSVANHLFEGQVCRSQYDTGKQVFENLLTQNGFEKTDLFGVDVIFYCASFLIGIALRYLMISLAIFRRTKKY